MQHTHPTGGDTSFVLYLRGHMYLNFYRIVEFARKDLGGFCSPWLICLSRNHVAKDLRQPFPIT